MTNTVKRAFREEVQSKGLSAEENEEINERIEKFLCSSGVEVRLECL